MERIVPEQKSWAAWSARMWYPVTIRLQKRVAIVRGPVMMRRRDGVRLLGRRCWRCCSSRAVEPAMDGRGLAGMGGGCGLGYSCARMINPLAGMTMVRLPLEEGMI